MQQQQGLLPKRTAKKDANRFHPFYTPLIANIDVLITFFRQEFSLKIRHIINGNESTIEDPLIHHSPGKILLGLLLSANTALNNGTKPMFSFEHFTTIVDYLLRSDRIYEIEDVLTAFTKFHISIIQDIKTSDEAGGGNFNYQDIDHVKARSMLIELLENDGKSSSGSTFWRIFLGIKREDGPAFVKMNADLIDKIRRLESFQICDPFKNAEFLSTLAIENPWMFAFFTTRQFTNLFSRCSIETIEKLKRNQDLQSATKSYSDEVLDSGKSLFSSSMEEKSSEAIEFPTLSQQERSKKVLVDYLVDPSVSVYTGALIDGAVASEIFLIPYRVIREFTPFLSPATLIDLYWKLDAYTPIRAKELKVRAKANHVEININASVIRGFIQYEWLLARIEADLKRGIDPQVYFNQSKKIIPYLLYDLFLRGTLSQFPLPTLLSIFNVIDPEIILETLQLLDPEDKINCFIYLGEYLSDTREKYAVDKSNKIFFLRVAQILLSDEFLSLRQNWLQNERAEKLIIQYPFLLKGLSYKAIQEFMSKLDKAKQQALIANAVVCIKNDLNPFTLCPILLAYLSPEKLIELYKVNKDIRWLFVGKALPDEVVIGFIKKNQFTKLAGEISELNDYLNPEFFNTVNPGLLDKELQFALITDKTTKVALKRYPSILNKFSTGIIHACAKDSVFLRQVVRQHDLIELILANFDHLIGENLDLLKELISVLYLNPESEAIVKILESRLQAKRDDLDQKYNHALLAMTDDLDQTYHPETDPVLLAAGKKKFSLNSAPYTYDGDYPEHPNQQHIDEMLESREINADPIVLLIEQMIKTLPDWASRFTRSAGFYPVLNQYCMTVLRSAGDNINRDYSALYQYAAVFIKLEDYKSAADYLIKFRNNLGVNITAEKSTRSAFHLLLDCADHLAESMPSETVTYYIFAATALLNAEEIRSIDSEAANTVIKTIRSRLIMIIEFAKKTIALVQKENIPKEESLRLMSLLHMLLLRIPNANHCSFEIFLEAIHYKYQLISLGWAHFGLQPHALINGFGINADIQFARDVDALLRVIQLIVKDGKVILPQMDKADECNNLPIDSTSVIRSLILQIDSYIAYVNQMNRDMLFDIIGLIRQRTSLHNNIEIQRILDNIQNLTKFNFPKKPSSNPKKALKWEDVDDSDQTLQIKTADDKAPGLSIREQEHQLKVANEAFSIKQQALLKAGPRLAEREQALLKEEQRIAEMEVILAKKEQAISKEEKRITGKEQAILKEEQRITENEQAILTEQQRKAEKDSRIAKENEAYSKRKQVLLKEAQKIAEEAALIAAEEAILVKEKAQFIERCAKEEALARERLAKVEREIQNKPERKEESVHSEKKEVLDKPLPPRPNRMPPQLTRDGDNINPATLNPPAQNPIAKQSTTAPTSKRVTDRVKQFEGEAQKRNADPEAFSPAFEEKKQVRKLAQGIKDAAQVDAKEQDLLERIKLAADFEMENEKKAGPQDEKEIKARHRRAMSFSTSFNPSLRFPRVQAEQNNPANPSTQKNNHPHPLNSSAVSAEPTQTQQESAKQESWKTAGATPSVQGRLVRSMSVGRPRVIMPDIFAKDQNAHETKPGKTFPASISKNNSINDQEQPKATSYKR